MGYDMLGEKWWLMYGVLKNEGERPAFKFEG